MQLGEVPQKHHVASRGPDGRLRCEECLTRAGLRRPVHHPLPPAPAPRAARPRTCTTGGRHPPRRRPHPHPLRPCPRCASATTAPRTCPSGGPADRRPHPAALERRRGRLARHARQRRPGLLRERRRRRSLLRRGGRRPASDRCSATSASPPSDYLLVPRGSLHRFLPDPGPQRWLSSRPGRSRPPAAVAQRRRPAPHGRALLPPRLPPPVASQGPIDEGIRSTSW